MAFESVRHPGEMVTERIWPNFEFYLYFVLLKLLTAASSLQNGLEVFSFKESFYKLDIANAILVITKYLNVVIANYL